MIRAVSLYLAVVLMWAAAPDVIAADAQPTAKNRLTAESKPSTAVEETERGRTICQNAPFPFNWNTSGMPYGWYHIEHGCKLHVVYDPKTRDVLKFRIVRDEVPIISLTGHRWLSFTTWESILLFADYRPAAPGCAVEGYDLEDGKRLWRTELTVADPGSPTIEDGTQYATRAALRFNHGVI